MLPRPQTPGRARKALAAGLALLLTPALGVGAHALFSHPLLSRPHVLRGAVDATHYAVTDTADDVNDVGSLRAAVAWANANPGGTITFGPSVTGTITLTGGELAVSQNVTIQGPGANVLTISGNNASRVFDFTNSSATDALSGLTLANGSDRNDGNGGGGVLSQAILTVTNCAITGSGANYGGGICGNNTLSITGSTLSGDTASGEGAGVYVGASATVNNCTFANDSAPYAGALDDEGSGLTVTSCTFSGDTGTDVGGGAAAGIFEDGNGVTVTGCLFTGNSGHDLFNYGGTFTSGGSNLLGDPSGNGFVNGTNHDQTGVSAANAKIGALAANGGPTQTCAVLTGSPAIGGDYANSTSVDQRGVARSAAHHTIGAYEYQAPVTVTSIAVTPASPSVAEGATRQFTATATYSDSSTANVTNTATWASDATGVATINASGLATGVRYGTAHVTASLNGVTSNSDALTITHVPTGLVVTNALDDGSPGCLRSVLLGAGPGDTITFDPSVTGTITLSGTELAISQSVTVQGPGAGVLTVSGNGASRIFNVTGGTVAISGLTMTDGNCGNGNSGGAVENAGGTLSLTGCVLSGNSAPGGQGGGFYNQSTTATLTNCVLTGNSTTGGGGEITNGGGHLVLTACTLADNSAGAGLNNYSSGTSTLTNDILWNDAGNYEIRVGSGTVTANYCDIHQSVGTYFTGSHDINVDPQFESGGSLRVRDGSPCTGAGTASGEPATDLSGTSRLSPPTIGAYEAPTLASLAVTPASPSVVEGATQQFTATATYSDAYTADVTGTATWASDATGVATINASGLATGVRYGTANVTASLGGVTSNSDALTVTHVPATLVVTNALDDGSAGCLRSVLAGAGPGDTVTFDPGVFSTAQTITLTGGELLTGLSVTIQGPGANLLTIDAGGNSRVFDFSSASATDAISGLTVADGNDGGNNGGGVIAGGALTVTACAFTNDTAAAGGGGLYGIGPLTVTGSTFSGGTAGGGGGALSISGGATVTDCTFAGNGAGYGGGLYDGGGVPITVTSCTFSGNSATSGAGSGGGLFENGVSATVTASVFTANAGGDVGTSGSSITSGGSNLLGDGDGHGFTNGANHDQTGVSNAMLGPLTDNGGPTQTCAVPTGSPANGGDYSGSTSVDQRGVARHSPQATIGAYEAPALTSLAVTPASPSVAKGLTQQFTATATYSDNSTADVTATAIWASDATGVATINAAGIATGVTVGTANVTASLNGVTSAQDVLTVTAPVVSSIAVTPTSPSLPAGLTQQFTATATYSDSTTADITATATWASDNTAAATINAGGLATGVAVGTANVTAALNGVTSPSDVLTVTAPNLTSLAVTPASPSVAEGATQQFTATATYSDNSTADVTGTATWSTDNTSIATIGAATGLATGVRYGTANVTASLGGVTSNSDALTVTHVPATLVVTNALDDGSAGCLRSVLAGAGPGDTVTFDPGVFSTAQTITLNGTQLALYQDVTIQGPGANLLTIDAGGSSRVLKVENATVSISGLTATNGHVTNSDPDTYGGGILNNTGTLTLTDCAVTNSRGDSDGGGVDTESGQLTTLLGCTLSGNVSGNNGGGIGGFGPLTVTNCTIVGNSAASGGGGLVDYGGTTVVNCTFAGNSAPSGGGIYGGDQLTVTASLFTGNTGGDIGNGGGTITSAGSNLLGDPDGNGFTNGVNNDQTGVTNALIGSLADNGGPTRTCAVFAGSPAIGGDYSGGTTTDQRGVARHLPQGTIGAYEYVAPTVTSIAVTPATASVAVGGTQQFTATATYSDASTGDVTSTALWASDNTAAATINAGGLATGVAVGTANVTAALNGVTSNAAALTVTAPTPATPVAHVLWNAADGQVQVWAVAADGSHTLTGLYGPYTDDGQGLWHATAIATAPDGTVRLLWNNSDGRVALWSLDAQGGITSLAGYGPYGEPGSADNWHATGLSVGPDGVTHLLWNHSDGRVTLWFVNPDGSYGLTGVYGPYGEPGSSDVWHATGVATGPDGVTRILWGHSDGRVTLWYVNADGSYGLSGVYGPYAEPNSTDNWAATAVSVGPDNAAHILWNHSDGRVALWYVNTDGSYGLDGVYGPYDEPGSSDVWHAASLATGSDGISRILWKHSDGRATLWYVNPDDSYGLTGVFAASVDGAGSPWEATAVSGD